MAKINKKEPDYGAISYRDIEQCKKLGTKYDILDDWYKVKLSLNTMVRGYGSPNSFAGNKVIYNYFLPEMLATRRKNDHLLREIMEDEQLKKKWIDRAIKMNRRPKNEYIEPVDIYECYRRCKGSINTFKASTAKYFLNKYGGTDEDMVVGDPCAGWGGRALATASLGWQYIGYDTNENLKRGYKKMCERLNIKDKVKMNYYSFLEEEDGNRTFNIVITSPPYLNIEKYNGMSLFENDEHYYKEFLIPLIDKLRRNTDGMVLINISEYMYQDYLKHGGRACQTSEPLPQQMGGKKNKEMMYVF